MPASTRITSRQHEIVRRFRQAARRNDPDVALLDGDHLLGDALDAGVPIEIVLADKRHASLAARAEHAGAQVFQVSERVIEAASPVRTPSGIVALARWRPRAMVDVLRPDGALVVGLCGVQDPGNVGSVIRAAEGLGATGVLALDDTAHPAGWKALRGAMGSAFRLPVAVGTTADALAGARRRGLQIVATVAANGPTIDATDFRKPSLILLGREGSGLEEAVVAAADVRATIPMHRGTNSLNVAAAAAVIAYEARRQRLHQR